MEPEVYSCGWLQCHVLVPSRDHLCQHVVDAHLKGLQPGNSAMPSPDQALQHAMQRARADSCRYALSMVSLASVKGSPDELEKAWADSNAFAEMRMAAAMEGGQRVHDAA